MSIDLKPTGGSDPVAKPVSILDYLLEAHVEINNRQVLIFERLEELTHVLQGLHAVVVSIQGQTSADHRKLEALRATAVASLEKLEELGQGAVTEVKHVVRDADGAITRVITTTPPAVRP